MTSPSEPLAFLVHGEELVNHFRPIWRALGCDAVEALTLGSGPDVEAAARAVRREGVRCVAAEERLAAGRRYRWLVSNHPVDITGEPLIRRLSHHNVRLMYALGKASWNLSDWNGLYDAILCFGPYHMQQLERFERPTKVQVGYPRFDDFFNQPTDRAALCRRFACDPQRPTLAWLPTWSTLSSVGVFDAAIAALRSDYNVVAKLHPLMPAAEPERVRDLDRLGLNHLITDATDNLDLYRIADFVLCDYGGPPFGALYTDRKLLLLNVPGAAGDALTGADSPDIRLREQIVSVEATDDIAGLLRDPAVWEAQRHQRRALRAHYFAPYYGFASDVAAAALTRLDLITGAG